MTEIFRPPLFQVENSAGVPLSGAKLYVYEPNSTTKVDLWQDDGLSITQANPAIADANGMFPAFWLDEATYKVVLTTSADVVVKTVDDITAAGGGAGSSVFADNVFFISGSIDATKLARFEADGITTATTRVYTLPNKDGTVAMTSDITTAVNAARDRRNRLVNPAMQISTVNGNTSATTDAYAPADNWTVNRVTSAGTITVQRVQSVTPKGAKDRIRVTITAADASLAAGEYLVVRQAVLAQEVADFQYGGASAKQSLLRFLFKGPAGTYAISLKNAALNRSYVALFTPASANTDEVISITISGDTTGTWTTDTTTWTMDVTLASGSTFQTTAGSWQAGNFLGTSAVTNGMGTINSVFEVSEVGWYLDPDSTAVAPAWELPSYREDSQATVGLSKGYVSAGQTITAAGALTLAHGLGVMPTLIQLRLKCLTAEGNYSIGDEVIINPADQDPAGGGGTSNRGASVVLDATNLNVRYSNAATTFNILNKTTGAAFGITNGNWNLIARAWA